MLLFCYFLDLIKYEEKNLYAIYYMVPKIYIKVNYIAKREVLEMSQKDKKKEKDELDNDKWQKFIDEYLVDLNITRAYKAVYGVKSNKVASASGSRLLGNVKVQEYLQKKRDILRDSTQITQERVILELACIAFAQFPDYVKIIDTVKKDKRGQSIEIKNWSCLTEEQKKAISKVKYGAKGIEIILHDKVKALELLGRYLGLFKDKVEIEPVGNSDWFKQEDE